jgi:hypothetical protein
MAIEMTHVFRSAQSSGIGSEYTFAQKRTPRMFWLAILGMLSMMIEGSFGQELSIECPAYIGNMHKEADIIAKFRADLEAGIVKSIHHE